MYINIFNFISKVRFFRMIIKKRESKISELVSAPSTTARHQYQYHHHHHQQQQQYPNMMSYYDSQQVQDQDQDQMMMMMYTSYSTCRDSLSTIESEVIVHEINLENARITENMINSFTVRWYFFISQ